jgi:hypothetical protein
MVGVHWITWDYIPKEGSMSELTYSWRFTRLANRLRARTLSENEEEDWISWTFARRFDARGLWH